MKNDKKKIETTSCDTCTYNVYDEDYEAYVCDVNMDEDDVARLFGDKYFNCPYYKSDDEYKIVRKQM